MWNLKGFYLVFKSFVNWFFESWFSLLLIPIALICFLFSITSWSDHANIS